MTKFFIFHFCLSFIVFRQTHGLDLNSLITTCSAKDPKLNDCVKEAGQKLIPQLSSATLKGEANKSTSSVNSESSKVKQGMKGEKDNDMSGIKEWSIPAIDPALTPEISFEDNRGGNNLVIIYKNIVQTGFSNIIIENADIDLLHGIMNFKLKYPQILFVADYSAKGRFYNFDVDGNGKANISVWNAFSSFALKYHVISDHIKHNSVIIGFSFDKIFLDYSNLVLNDDMELSKSAGKFINENSAEVIEGFKPELEKFYGRLTGEFLQALFDAMPYSVLFKDL